MTYEFIIRDVKTKEDLFFRKKVPENRFAALKALEIIKKKCPFFNLFSDEDNFCPKGHYRVYDNELYQFNELTKEEYELLKEILK